MGFLGGLVGGVIGGIFAGPWGAVIGATVGAAVSSSSDKDKQKAKAAHTEDPNEKRLLGLILLFETMAKLCKADGRVTPDEAAFVSSLLKSFGETPLDRSMLKKAFDRAKTDRTPLDFYLSELAALYDERGRLAILEIFCGLARVDGTVSEAEMNILRQAESVFGLYGSVDRFFQREGGYNRSGRASDGADHQERRSSSRSASLSLNESYKLLGCKPSDSDQTIKRAWRKKALEFHPDKLIGKGLSEAFIEFADQEMKKINKAYDAIMESRGPRA